MENNKKIVISSLLIGFIFINGCNESPEVTETLNAKQDATQPTGSQVATITTTVAAPEATLVYQGTICNEFERSTRWISSEDELNNLYQSLSQHLVGGDTEMPFAAPDFSKENYLVLFMGTKPTPGYGVNLVSANIDETNNRWNITIDEIEPPADRILSQVLTSPCSVIAVKADSPTEYQIKKRDGSNFIEATTAK